MSNPTAEAQQQELCINDNEVCYIRLHLNPRKNWSDAQQTCKQLNSTLAIVDNVDRRNSFLRALYNFSLNGTDVWIGARATYGDPKNWMWIDGTPYNQSRNMKDVQQQGEFYKSYSFISNQSTGMEFTAAPNSLRPYICKNKPISQPSNCVDGSQQMALNLSTGCYVLHKEPLSWFAARNICLSNGGDLATFYDFPSIPLFPTDSTGYWVGLRSSWWNWKNAVTGASTDVTFTLWRDGEPDDADPHCINTNPATFPSWRDMYCTALCNFICQRASSLSTTSQPTLKTASDKTFPSSPTANSSELYGNIKTDNSVGLGVGLGVPLILTIIALTVLIVLLVRRNCANRKPTKNETIDHEPNPRNVDASHEIGSNGQKVYEELSEETRSKEDAYQSLSTQNQDYTSAAETAPRKVQN